MRVRLTQPEIVETLQRALGPAGIIGIEDTAAIFYDLDYLEERAADLRGRFPESALHAAAVKANPVLRVLEVLRRAGLGAEAASLPEIHLALAAGFDPQNIIFDSPAKTEEELEFAITNGIHVNADSLEELDQIESLLGSTPPEGTIGLRINPQIGEGRNRSTSTAGEYSKFGVPLKQFRTQIIERYRRHLWLSGVHVHIGSQTIAMEQLLDGIDRIVGLVQEIENEIEPGRITIFDLGGGLPVSYHDDDVKHEMGGYSEALRHRFPELFSAKYKLITEFGRYLHSPAGWSLSRVQSVKRDFAVFDKRVNTAMIHLGADMFLRKCYNPDKWDHELFVTDSEGRPKTGRDVNPYKVAGPLCFSGDIIAENLPLPMVEAGDYVVVRDTGAYTLSMWSRYNSRQIPVVLGYRENGRQFEILRKRETVESVVQFWSQG